MIRCWAVVDVTKPPGKDGRRDLCRGNWRRAPVRYTTAADVLSRLGAGGKLDGRHRAAQGADPGGQSTPRRVLRLDISLTLWVCETVRDRIEGLRKPVRDITWKAQPRLCAGYRRLSATGKKLPVVIAAIAREMAAWAIGLEVVRSRRRSHAVPGFPPHSAGVGPRWGTPVANLATAFQSPQVNAVMLLTQPS